MKTALITGANRGIGLGLAAQFRDRGFDVIGTSRDPDDAAELANMARVVRLDVTDDESVRALREQLGAEGMSIDVLINNAGWARDEYAVSLADVIISIDKKVFEVNTLGPLRMLQGFADLLSANAKVVNISTRLASLTNMSGVNDPLYAASKVSLNMLTRQLAFDDAFAGRCMISVSPGWVRTRMGGKDAALSVEESTDQLANLIEKLTPADTGKFFNYDGTIIPW